MLYHSTRSGAQTVDSAQAVLSGLAPDGGLYVPQEFPAFDAKACLAKDTMGMASMIIGAMLPDIPYMEEPFKQAFQSKAGIFSGIYRPPSGARPSRTAWALSTAAELLRVEWYNITSS